MSSLRTLLVLGLLGAGCGPITQLPGLLKSANTAASNTNALKQLLDNNNIGPIDTSQITVIQNQ